MPARRSRAVRLVALVLVGLLAVALDAAGHGCGRGGDSWEPWCGPHGHDDGDDDRGDDREGGKEGEGPEHGKKDGGKDDRKEDREDDEEDRDDKEEREDDREDAGRGHRDEDRRDDAPGDAEDGAGPSWTDHGLRGLWPFPLPPPEEAPSGPREADRVWPDPCKGDCGAAGDPPPRVMAGVLAAIAVAGAFVAWRTR